MDPRDTLLTFLEQEASAFGWCAGLAYRGPAGFVLEHGVWFDPAPWPRGYWQGAPLSCFGNAIMVAATAGLPYVEGYALTPGLGTAFQHAWNLDGRGRLLDTTWRNTGLVYCGVCFSLGRADDATWCGNQTVLDDSERNWPLLRQWWEGEDVGRAWPESEALRAARLSACATSRRAGDKRFPWRI